MNKDKSSSAEALVLPIALLLYILLSGFVTYYDLRVFINWSSIVDKTGLFGIYRASELLGYAYRVVYPPLAPLMFIASYDAVRGAISTLTLSFSGLGAATLKQFIVPFIERILLKTPLMTSALALWRVVRRAYGRETSALILLGPPVLFVIALYNFDLPMILFAMASLTLLHRGRRRLSAILFSASVLSKQASIILLPVLLVHVYRKWGGRAVLEYLGITALTTSIVLAPFIAASGPALAKWMVEFQETRPPQGPSISTAVYVLSGYKETSLLSLTETVSTLLTVILIAYTLYLYLRRGGGLWNLTVSSAAVFTVLLAFSKVVNPVYTLWGYPFIAVLAARDKRMNRLFWAYIAASIVVYIWFFSLYSSALITSSPAYLYEERRWVGYSELVAMLRGSMGPYGLFLDLLLLIARSNHLLWSMASIMYQGWGIATALMAATYTMLMVYVYLGLLRGLEASQSSSRRSLA
ncbi:MAG: hypothetical protein ABWW69_03235 [Pyrodictiaceae archaeon]